MYILIYIYISLHVVWNNNVQFWQFKRSISVWCLRVCPLPLCLEIRWVFESSDKGLVLAGWVVMRILRSIVTPCPPLLWQPGVWWLQCVLVWLALWRAGAPGVCWSCPRMMSCPRPPPCELLAWFYSAWGRSRVTTTERHLANHKFNALTFVWIVQRSSAQRSGKEKVDAK